MIRKKTEWVNLFWWLGLALVMGCGAVASNSDRYTKMKASLNFEKGRFVNLHRFEVMQPGGLWPVMKERFWGNNHRSPAAQLPVQQIDASFFPEPPGRCQAVWLGHSFLILDLDGVRILIDPVFDNAAPVPLAVRRFQPPPIAREQLPKADVVIISHNHYDHLEKRTIQQLGAAGVLFITPLGVGRHLNQWGIANSQIIELDWWESFTVRQVELMCTPSQHFSSRSLLDRNNTLWGSWSLLGPDHRVFYSSDGGWGDHFAQIGQRCGPFDLTFIEIGAYADQWPQVHMRPEQSIEAHLALKGKVMIPVHWAAYDLALHPWDEPIERAWAAAQKNAVVIETPMMGELFIGQIGSTSRWWVGIDP